MTFIGFLNNPACFNICAVLAFILRLMNFLSIMLKILMTAPCGVCAISCVRTGSDPIAAAVETATFWSSIGTAELMPQVSGTFMCNMFRRE